MFVLFKAANSDLVSSDCSLNQGRHRDISVAWGLKSSDLETGSFDSGQLSHLLLVFFRFVAVIIQV